jgi:hypothetical protein
VSDLSAALTLGFVVPLLAAALAATTFFRRRRRATLIRGATTHALFTPPPPSSPSVVMPSDIVALPVKALKQRLDALVVAVEANEEKAATARHRVLSARQLLAEEQAAATNLERQAAATNLERQAAAKKLVPESTSFSTTETATASPLYVTTFVANLPIQADTMMEDIHLDTSGPAVTPTAFYSNKTMSASLSPLLAPPRPPGKNSDNGGNHSGNTTVVSHGATTNDDRGPPPWPTYVNPSQGHIAMYPGPSPTGRQRS